MLPVTSMFLALNPKPGAPVAPVIPIPDVPEVPEVPDVPLCPGTEVSPRAIACT